VNLDWAWIQRNLAMIGNLLVDHIILSVLPVLIALVISLPLGFLVLRPSGSPTSSSPFLA